MHGCITMQCPYTSEDSKSTLESIRKLQKNSTENFQLSSETICENYIDLFNSTLVRWEEDKKKFNYDQIVVLCSLMKKAKESALIREAHDIGQTDDIDQAHVIDHAHDIDTTQIFRFLQEYLRIVPNNTNNSNENENEDPRTMFNFCIPQAEIGEYRNMLRERYVHKALEHLRLDAHAAQTPLPDTGGETQNADTEETFNNKFRIITRVYMELDRKAQQQQNTNHDGTNDNTTNSDQSDESIPDFKAAKACLETAISQHTVDEPNIWSQMRERVLFLAKKLSSELENAKQYSIALTESANLEQKNTAKELMLMSKHIFMQHVETLVKSLKTEFKKLNELPHDKPEERQRPVLDLTTRHVMWTKVPLPTDMKNGDGTLKQRASELETKIEDKIKQKLQDNKLEIGRYWLRVNDLEDNEWAKICDTCRIPFVEDDKWYVFKPYTEVARCHMGWKEVTLGTDGDLLEKNLGEKIVRRLTKNDRPLNQYYLDEHDLTPYEWTQISENSLAQCNIDGNMLIFQALAIASDLRDSYDATVPPAFNPLGRSYVDEGNPRMYSTTRDREAQEFKVVQALRKTSKHISKKAPSKQARKEAWYRVYESFGSLGSLYGGSDTHPCTRYTLFADYTRQVFPNSAVFKVDTLDGDGEHIGVLYSEFLARENYEKNKEKMIIGQPLQVQPWFAQGCTGNEGNVRDENDDNGKRAKMRMFLAAYDKELLLRMLQEDYDISKSNAQELYRTLNNRNFGSREPNKKYLQFRLQELDNIVRKKWKFRKDKLLSEWRLIWRKSDRDSIVRATLVDFLIQHKPTEQELQDQHSDAKDVPRMYADPNVPWLMSFVFHVHTTEDFVKVLGFPTDKKNILAEKIMRDVYESMTKVYACCETISNWPNCTRDCAYFGEDKFTRAYECICVAILYHLFQKLSVEFQTDQDEATTEHTTKEIDPVANLWKELHECTMTPQASLDFFKGLFKNEAQVNKMSNSALNCVFMATWKLHLPRRSPFEEALDFETWIRVCFSDPDPSNQNIPQNTDEYLERELDNIKAHFIMAVQESPDNDQTSVYSEMRRLYRGVCTDPTVRNQILELPKFTQHHEWKFSPQWKELVLFFVMHAYVKAKQKALPEAQVVDMARVMMQEYKTSGRNTPGRWLETLPNDKLNAPGAYARAVRGDGVGELPALGESADRPHVDLRISASAGTRAPPKAPPRPPVVGQSGALIGSPDILDMVLEMSKPDTTGTQREPQRARRTSQSAQTRAPATASTHTKGIKNNPNAPPRPPVVGQSRAFIQSEDMLDTILKMSKPDTTGTQHKPKRASQTKSVQPKSKHNVHQKLNGVGRIERPKPAKSKPYPPITEANLQSNTNLHKRAVNPRATAFDSTLRVPIDTTSTSSTARNRSIIAIAPDSHGKPIGTPRARAPATASTAIMQTKVQKHTSLHDHKLNPNATDFHPSIILPMDTTGASSTAGNRSIIPRASDFAGKSPGSSRSSSPDRGDTTLSGELTEDANLSTAENFRARARKKIMDFLSSHPLPANLPPAYGQYNGKIPDVLLRSLSDANIKRLVTNENFLTSEIRITQSNMQHYRDLLHGYIMQHLHVLTNPLYVNGIIGFMVGDLTKQRLAVWSESDESKKKLIEQAETTLVRLGNKILSEMKQKRELEHTEHQPKHVVNVLLAFLDTHDLHRCLRNTEFRRRAIAVAKHKLNSWRDSIIDMTHNLYQTNQLVHKLSVQSIFAYLLNTQHSNILDQSLDNRPTAQYLVFSAVEKLTDYSRKILERLKAYEESKNEESGNVQLNKEKLTGMFLDGLSVEEMDTMLRENDYLTTKIAEANVALEKNAQMQAQRNQGDLPQSEQPAAAPAAGGAVVNDKKRAPSPEVPTPDDTDQTQPASPEVPDAGPGAAGGDAQESGVGTTESWPSRLQQGAPQAQGVPTAVGKPKAQARALPGASRRQEQSSVMTVNKYLQTPENHRTDEDERYHRLFEAMQQMFKELNKIPNHDQALCDMVAQALMIRHCLSEWFPSSFSLHMKSGNTISGDITIEIVTLMLSPEEIVQHTKQKSKICIFPSGADAVYSIEKTFSKILQRNQEFVKYDGEASDIYKNFTKAATKVFHDYFPDFCAQNRYSVPIPFVFGGALESRRKNRLGSDDSIDTMLRSWPEQRTNISIDRFKTPVSWSVQAFAFDNKLELQDVKPDGECFFYAIAWMSMPMHEQQKNSNVKDKYTDDFLKYCMSLKQAMLDFMLKFLSDTWEPANFSAITGANSVSFLEILLRNYDESEPDPYFMKLAKNELSDRKYQTLINQIGRKKLERVYAVKFNFMNSEYTRYGDLNTFGDLLCSILDIEKGIHLINTQTSNLHYSSKCGKLLDTSKQQTWNDEIANIQQHLFDDHGAVLGIDKMYLLLKKGLKENGNHYIAMRPVNPRVQDQRRFAMLDLCQQLQPASVPQQEGAGNNASACFGQPNPQENDTRHQGAAHETRLVHSAGAAGARDYAPPTSSAAVCKQPDVAAEVAQLRQLAQAASKHAAPSRSTVAAEVAQLRQLASARNAAAQTASKHAAPSSSTVAAEVAQLRQLAAARNAAAQAARKHAAPSSSTVAAEVAQLRQLAAARNAAAQAASGHAQEQKGSAAVCKQPDVAAEVQKLRQLASARNAAATAAGNHAAPSSSTVAAEVAQLRQLASARQAMATAASKHAAPSESRVQELRGEALQAFVNDELRGGSKMSFKQAGVAARVQEMHVQALRTS